MNIVVLEPFYTGSHASWTDGLREHSRHTITPLTLPGRHWKWRMHGASITLAEKFLKLPTIPDLLLVSDMLDLTTFLSLTRRRTANLPTALYFHENQLTYPWSPYDNDKETQKDHHYSFVNYTSALVADYILFNTDFHKNSFLNALPYFLQQFPDFNNLHTVASIEKKSTTVHLGIDLQRFDSFKSYSGVSINSKPLLLWNHRWEYDKNPRDFFDMLYALQASGIDFDVALLGKAFDTMPEDFHYAQSRLAGHILHCGYAESYDEYAYWLWKADILPVTSIQEFFGISVIEALYCGCIPVVPNRLTYPELIPQDLYKNYFYQNNNMLEVMQKILATYDTIDRTSFQELAAQYDWSNMISVYDEVCEKMVCNTHAH